MPQLDIRSRIGLLPRLSPAGFAMIASLALIPLIVAMATAIGITTYAYRAKLHAQGICLYHSSQLQMQLQRALKKILSLNSRAQHLRRKRQLADARYAIAIASGTAAAILTARAYRSAVIAEQSALRAQQSEILMGANYIRRSSLASLTKSAVYEGLLQVRDLSWKSPGLAVRAAPADSLTPGYFPVENFKVAQQQTYEISYHVLPPALRKTLASVQKTVCSVSLEKLEAKWSIAVNEAKPLLSWP